MDGRGVPQDPRFSSKSAGMNFKKGLIWSYIIDVYKC